MPAGLLFGPDFLKLVFTDKIFVASMVVSHGMLYFGEACFRGVVKPSYMLCLHHVLFSLLLLVVFQPRSMLTLKVRDPTWLLRDRPFQGRPQASLHACCS